MARVSMANRKKGAALKYAVILVLCVGAAALLAWLFLTRGEVEEAAPAPEAPPPVSEPAPIAEAPRVITGPYAQSEYAAVIEDGLTFVAEHHLHHQRDWQTYVLLDYLHRKFGLDEKYAIAKTCPPELVEESDRPMAYLLGRLANPAHRIEPEQLGAATDPITETTLRALYCDQYPVDAAFVDATLAVVAKEAPPDNPLAGYVKSHFILSLEWLTENGCAEAFPQVAAARPGFADVLCGLVEQEQASTDLAFEAMAVLFYLGFDDRVRDEWFGKVAALQLPSGGWVYDPKKEAGGEGHGHPTALATWVLLERALPEAAHVPWLGAKTGNDIANEKTEPDKKEVLTTSGS